MDYGVKDALIKSLVNVLKPPKKLEKPDNTDCDYFFIHFSFTFINFTSYFYYKQTIMKKQEHSFSMSSKLPQRKQLAYWSSYPIR